jgi:hypothetical protein
MDTTATAITTTFTWGVPYYDDKGHYAMPEMLERNAFHDQHNKNAHHLTGNVDTLTVILRRVIVDSNHIYNTDNNWIGCEYITDLRWVVLDTSTDTVMFSNWYKFDTQKKAESEMRKWKKNIIAHQAEAATLAELKDITMPTAFMSATDVKALPLPNADTQVGDLVQVRGFGKQRAGYVIEASPVRVKCIIRTVESTKRQNEGDHGYCKWFKKVVA